MTEDTGRRSETTAAGPSPLRRFVEYPLSFGEYQGEPETQRGRRRVIVGAFWFSIPFISLPALVTPGPWISVMFLAKGASHLVAVLWIKRFPRAYAPAVHMALGVGLASDVGVTILLGGLYESGLHIGWSLINGPLALIAFSVGAAAIWSGLYAAAVVFATTAASSATARYELPDPEVDAMITIVMFTGLILIVTAYFVRQRDRYQRQSDDLLSNILPAEVAARLKAGSEKIADHFEAVTVLFADVVDFTPMSAEMTPSDLVELLDTVFSDIDVLVAELGLEKIKTVGDEYMVAAGVPSPREDHAVVAAELALRINDHVAGTRFDGHPIRFRIGLHTGPVVAGVIGRKKFAYDLWGDVVNTASRMESHGVAGRIQVSDETRRALADRYVFERRGTVDVKGKGPMTTWFLEGRV